MLLRDACNSGAQVYATGKGTDGVLGVGSEEHTLDSEGHNKWVKVEALSDKNVRFCRCGGTNSRYHWPNVLLIVPFAPLFRSLAKLLAKTRMWLMLLKSLHGFSQGSLELSSYARMTGSDAKNIVLYMHVNTRYLEVMVFTACMARGGST